MPLAKDAVGCSSGTEPRKKTLAGVRGALKRVFSFSKSNKKGTPADPVQSPSGSTKNNDEAMTLELLKTSLTDGAPTRTTLQQQLQQQQQQQQQQHRETVGENATDGKEQPGRMAVFRKFLSATKNKIKSSNIKVEESTSAQADEEFEHRKQEWQEELDQMSDFLVLKSTEEQREEGVENPLDTAYIEDRDGLPLLKACFDVQYFKPEEIQLNVEDGYLTLFAQSLEEKTVAVFKKTMIRKMEIPRYVDHKMMHCSLSDDQKVLTVEMPFHLPPQKRPMGPTVVPVLNDSSGKRKIRLAFSIGPDFAQDDVTVKLDGERCLIVEASYEAEIGLYGSQVTRRQFYKKFRLPDFIHVDKVEQNLTDKGQLFVDLILKDDPSFKVKVTTETLEEINGGQDEEEEEEEEDEKSPSIPMPEDTTEKDKNYADDNLSPLEQTPLQSKSESGSDGDNDDDDSGGDDDDDENRLALDASKEAQP